MNEYCTITMAMPVQTTSRRWTELAQPVSFCHE